MKTNLLRRSSKNGPTRSQLSRPRRGRHPRPSASPVTTERHPACSWRLDDEGHLVCTWTR